jgi:DinB superfamily
MMEAANRLARILGSVPPRLCNISESDAAVRSAPGRWSKKEILGHLIDSAGNNHQRFVRAQFVPVLEFPGHEQEAWVAAQAYATESWPDLVNLWLLLNRHLVHIIEAMPETCYSHECAIGGQPPVTLSTLLEAYVAHLEHHLDQIFTTSL